MPDECASSLIDPDVLARARKLQLLLMDAVGKLTVRFTWFC
jgi:hypothetical protein